MANCPYCNNKLNFWNVIFLSRVSNRLICKSCETVVEANKSALSLYGVTSAILFLILIKNGERWFGFENILISTVVALTTFILASILFFYRVKLKISKNQDKNDLKENLNLKERPKLPDNYTRTEYLKNKFYDKSNSELQLIIKDPNRILEAREAAKQLLRERGI